jgi:hypothetical protein
MNWFSLLRRAELSVQLLEWLALPWEPSARRWEWAAEAYRAEEGAAAA